MTRFSHRSLTKLVLGLVILTGALGGPLLAGGAHAQIGACRTDPTVTLSNGVSVTMWATMQTDISTVQSVTYVLHVPKGVTMTGITYDSSGSLEHVSIVADQTGTQYEDVTTTTLTSGSVSMTAYATRRDSTVASQNGTTGKAITLHWAT
jgi:hypothetical protein